VPYVEEGLREVGGVEHGEQDGQDHHQDLCEQGPNDPGCYASPARSKREKILTKLYKVQKENLEKKL
jgi:hypothetical protein